MGGVLAGGGVRREKGERKEGGREGEGSWEMLGVGRQPFYSMMDSFKETA